MPRVGPKDWLTEELEAALSIAGAGVWCYEPGIERTRWSQTVAELFGLPQNEVPKDFEAFLEYVHPDDRNLVRTRVGEAAQAASRAAASLYARM